MLIPKFCTASWRLVVCGEAVCGAVVCGASCVEAWGEATPVAVAPSAVPVSSADRPPPVGLTEMVMMPPCSMVLTAMCWDQYGPEDRFVSTNRQNPGNVDSKVSIL